jgi:hypothetical protein
MYVAFNAPHDPRQAPREFLDLYPPKKLKIPPNFLPKHPFPIEAGFDGRDEILAPYPRTPEVICVHLQEYYALITHLDAQVGRILDALEASGKAANTIIIFTSDQGLAVGQHGLMGKQNLYDHSLRCRSSSRVRAFRRQPTTRLNMPASRHNVRDGGCAFAARCNSQRRRSSRGKQCTTPLRVPRPTACGANGPVETHPHQRPAKQLFDAKRPLETRNLATDPNTPSRWRCSTASCAN